MGTSRSLSVLQEWGVNHRGAMTAHSVDLSTVEGNLDLITLIQQSGHQPFDLVFFTIGCWPDYNSSFTADGVEKQVSLDLLSHHVLLNQLYRNELLAPAARIMNTVASTQRFPFVDRQA